MLSNIELFPFCPLAVGEVLDISYKPPFPPPPIVTVYSLIHTGYAVPTLNPPAPPPPARSPPPPPPPATTR